MEIIEVLRNNTEIAEMLDDVCDIKILSSFKVPEDEFGHLTYSILGKTFAKDNSGGEYILLEDGSVGYWSSEGETGRISDDLTEFFEFMINCPHWKNYLNSKPYKDIDKLRQFAFENYREYIESEQEYWDEEIHEVQRELATKLGLSLYNDVAETVLMKFYYSTTRVPGLIATYTENDGSNHSNSGSLIETE